MSKIVISIMSSEQEQSYDAFLQQHVGSLFYHSLKYRNFLKEILKNSEDWYILAYQNNELVGVLPVFLKRFSDGKSIINSLPFFGSHGGVLVSDSVTDQMVIRSSLIKKLLELAHDQFAISLTIVDNPFNMEENYYENSCKIQAVDKRISQVTDISINNIDNADLELMSKFHQKTRNMVRKGIKSDFRVEINNTIDAFKLLYEMHTENMIRIGGTGKPFFVFNGIYRNFEAKKDYDIYFAYKNNEVAAGLLVFYYKNYCEYFTPVINQRYRSEQPLSLLIFKAMQDAAINGCRYWNWGGTWLTQDGVYLFKKRWGATEKVYKYFNKIFNDDHLKIVIESMTENSFFYICPGLNLSKI